MATFRRSHSALALAARWFSPATPSRMKPEMSVRGAAGTERPCSETNKAASPGSSNAATNCESAAGEEAL